MKWKFALLLLAMITASGAAANIAVSKMGAASKMGRKVDPADRDFKMRDLPTEVFQSPLDAAKFYLRSFPESGEGRPKLALRMIKDPLKNYTFILTITAEGYLDDSVAGKQWRLGIDRGETGWAVNMAGERWKCYRGKRALVWTIKPCR